MIRPCTHVHFGPIARTDCVMRSDYYYYYHHYIGRVRVHGMGGLFPLGSQATRWLLTILIVIALAARQGALNAETLTASQVFREHSWIARWCMLAGSTRSRCIYQYTSHRHALSHIRLGVVRIWYVRAYGHRLNAGCQRTQRADIWAHKFEFHLGGIMQTAIHISSVCVWCVEY